LLLVGRNNFWIPAHKIKAYEVFDLQYYQLMKRFAEVACTFVFGVVSITTSGNIAVLGFEELEFAKETFEMLRETTLGLLRTFDSFFRGSSKSRSR